MGLPGGIPKSETVSCLTAGQNRPRIAKQICYPGRFPDEPVGGCAKQRLES